MTDNLPPSTPPQTPATLGDAQLPDTQLPDDSLPDRNTRNPDDYRWVPVLRKRRKDGWSPAKQRRFIEALADTGSVLVAAQSVGMTDRSAQMLRRSPGAQGFDRAWSAAIDAASKKLLDEAFERALIGSDEPVFDRDGNRVGRRFRKSERMLQFLLRGYFPERFGHYGHIEPGLSEKAPSDAVTKALDRLVPATPAEPHRLMAPEELDVALDVADMLDGELPHYYRDPEPEPARPDDDAPQIYWPPTEV